MTLANKIFITQPGLTSPDSVAGPGFVWLNKPEAPIGSLRAVPAGPFPDHGFGIGTGFPENFEEPVLVTGKEHGRVPLRDFENVSGFFWLLSDRAKQMIEEIDPSAFAFCPVVTKTSGRERHPGERWLCDLVQCLDAIDEVKSKLRVTEYPGGQRLVQIDYPDKAIFRRSIVGSAHIFRSPYNSFECYCTAHFQERVRAAGLKGLGFMQVGVLDDKA